MTVDLSTTYLGLKLKNPVAASCSPLTGKVDSLKQLEDAGVSAVVLPSLFEEQIEQEEMQVAKLKDFGAEGFAEAMSFFPDLGDYNIGPDKYLELVAQAKKSLSIPVIASLNGTSKGGWLRYAKMYQEAGADAIELNIYYLATDPELDSVKVEQRYLELIKSVSSSVSIPVAVKTGPFFTAMAHMARRIEQAGAKGLVLFNRFMQPDIDLETLEVTPELELSTPAEARLPLRWVAVLRGRTKLCLAANSGVHSGADVAKLVLAGADVTMCTSALLRHGPSHAAVMLSELSSWLEEKEYTSIQQCQGSMSQENVKDPAAFERANYMKAIVNYTSDYR